jgi:PAS domain S-box-containing protein
LFTWLVPAQWALVAIYAGTVSIRHGFGLGPLLVAAIGGMIISVPVLGFILWRPGHIATRIAVAAAHAGFAGIFIHLSGHRPEAYFYSFGALAFLGLYRDWRIAPIATILIVVHHVGLVLWWPEMLRDVFAGTPWREAEFAAGLVLENVALGIWCLVWRREQQHMLQRENEHRRQIAQLEQRFHERTLEWESQIAARDRVARELRENEQQHRNLVAALPIGIFETTRSGAVRFANPHLLSLIGLPEKFDSTQISLGDGRIFPIAERERFWHRLESEGEVRGFSASLQHFDGSAFEVIINARVKRTPPGQELIAEGTVEDVTSRKRAAREVDLLHNQLLVASRQAGMAEVATGVLHNVGNVLTSVNLIVHDVQDRLRSTRLVHLRRVVEVLQREQPRLAEFFTGDGKQLPDFLKKLDDHLTAENTQLIADVEGLVRHFEHIREIIVTQQSSAQLLGLVETLPASQLLEDALLLNAESMERHGIHLERLFEPCPGVKADRHRVLQILVNLLKNAKDAMQIRKPGDRLIHVRIAPASAGIVALSVQDNGQGIAPGDLKRIFQHGFTTKKTGHGFGLHSSVLAAREMGGDLVAESPGPGQGSTFILTLPSATADTAKIIA